MRSSSVRDILLAYAIETAAPNEALPNAARCEVITQDTLHALGHPGAKGGSAGREQFLNFVVQRAQRIIQASQLPDDVRQVWKHAPGLARWVPLAVLAGALVIGFAMHRITDPHRVDLLAPSLLGIVLWNLAVYLWMAGSCLYGLFRREPAAPPVLEPANSGAAAPAAATGWRSKLRARLPGAGGSTGLRRMALSFERNWWNLSRRMRHAQWLMWLHLGAAFMAVGALASLWMTGLTNAYQVGWESTFLSADQVHTVLNTLFAPVHWLTGQGTWGIEEIRSLQGWVSGQTATGDQSVGRQWVLAYTSLLALLVIAPRLLLAAWQWLRARWAANTMPLPLTQPYFQKLQRDYGGLAITLHVLPYSFELNDTRREALRHYVAQQYGAGAHLVMEPALAYGAKLPSAASVGGDKADTAAVLLINMAATPEAEIHGELLQTARERWGSDAAIWLWTQDFAERNTGAPKRVQERRELWGEFVRHAGLAASWI